MAIDDPAFLDLVRAIVDDNQPAVSRMLAQSPPLATRQAGRGATRRLEKDYFFDEIAHHMYAGDTALHIAAAAHRPELVGLLLDAHADVDARNRRGARPLHYAADGVPGSAIWRPDAQAATVICLIAAGADPNVTDKSGVAPLHRAVRTRCSGAVAALLDGGADPQRPNSNGSTPMQLAMRNTGRGGSGAAVAKAEQERIVRLLEAHGAR